MGQNDFDSDMDRDEVEDLGRLAVVAKDDLEGDSEDGLPSTGLLSFYDRLRARIHGYVEEKGGGLASQTADLFLLIPDVFVFLLRLTLDKNVPKESRMLIGGALAYFVLPVDLLPEAFVGPAGYADDLVLAIAVLAQAFGRDLEPYAEKYWSGSGSLRRVVGDVLTAGHGLLGADLHQRLRHLLASKGVDLDAVEEEHGDDPAPA